MHQSALKLFLSGLLLIPFAASTLTFVTREEWDAKAPDEIIKFDGPIPYIIIHHSESPQYCPTTEICKKYVKSIQRYHMEERHWKDIGYSFLIGGDGKIYIGRGFNVVAAHAPNYNNKSVGICLIGNYKNELPPQLMLNVTKEFIEYSVSKGYVAKDFKLLGHRQVRATDCPGDKLFNEIETWDHFSPKP